jgi:ketosteroid isomerase-like protein
LIRGEYENPLIEPNTALLRGNLRQTAGSAEGRVLYLDLAGGRDTAWAMSEENVKTVQRGFDAVGRGDLSAMAAELAPEFEYVPTGAFVGVRETSAGAEGFMRFLESFWEEFNEPSIELRQLTDAGEAVLTWVTFRGRGTQSRAETSLDLWIVWTLRDGKLIRGQAFRSNDEARTAAGLSE